MTVELVIYEWQTFTFFQKQQIWAAGVFYFIWLLRLQKKEKVIALIIFDACSANGLSAKIGDYFVMKLAIFLCQRVPEWFDDDSANDVLMTDISSTMTYAP